MSRLQDWQRHFIDAVRQPHRPSSPIADTPGLDVYRNNIRSSLIEALKDTFPHTLTLLGERCFVGEASRFVAHHPPRDPRLAHYGGDFVTALRQSPDVSRYRFVADIAGLEHARLRVSHAADSIPLEACELAPVSTASAVWYRPCPPVGASLASTMWKGCGRPWKEEKAALR